MSSYLSKLKTKILLCLLITAMFFPAILSKCELTQDRLSIDYIQAAQTGPQVFDFHVAISPSNKLHLIYREKIGDIDQICYLESSSKYVWNQSKNILIAENNTHKFSSRPSITTKNEELFAVYGFEKGEKTGIILLVRNATTKIWSSKIVIEDIEGSISNPIIAYNANQTNFWLSWEDNHEGFYNQYLMTGNSSSLLWVAPTRLSSNESYNSLHGNFILDEDGNGHFVWKEGLESHEKILYSKVYSNGTLTAIEEITDGTYRCIKPAIIIDQNKKINVFWNNHSDPNPGLFLGTKFIYSSIRENDNWSTPFEVGPFIPEGRPSSGESDAFTAAVCLLKPTNELWLAYEITEDYAYHSGIDIRNREGASWQPSSFLSLVNNRAKDPQLLASTNGDLICFWIDARAVTNQVYFRIRFANEAWSNEIPLTAFKQNYFSTIWLYVLIIIVTVIILAIPSIVVRIIYKKRKEKYIREKIRNLG